jgi:hypothetical protein
MHHGSKKPSNFGLAPLPPLSQRAGASSSYHDAARIIFTDVEMGIIRKEKNL